MCECSLVQSIQTGTLFTLKNSFHECCLLVQYALNCKWQGYQEFLLDGKRQDKKDKNLRWSCCLPEDNCFYILLTFSEWLRRYPTVQDMTDYLIVVIVHVYRRLKLHHVEELNTYFIRCLFGEWVVSDKPLSAVRQKKKKIIINVTIEWMPAKR